MENLFTILIFIGIVLVKGLAAKKQSDRQRPVRRQRRPMAPPPMIPDEPVKPSVPETDSGDGMPASLEEWLKQFEELDEAAPVENRAPEVSPAEVIPAPAEQPSMSDEIAPAPQRQYLSEEEVLQKTKQVAAKSIDAALPDVVKTARRITAPRMHPVRVSTKNLRQAVIMSEVLARPRAFDL